MIIEALAGCRSCQPDHRINVAERADARELRLARGTPHLYPTRTLRDHHVIIACSLSENKLSRTIIKAKQWGHDVALYHTTLDGELVGFYLFAFRVASSGTVVKTGVVLYSHSSYRLLP